MLTYTQAGRPLAVETPLGPDMLLLEAVRGTEAVSELFRFELDVLADARLPTPDFARLVGRPASVRIDVGDGRSRVIRGIFSRFSQGPPVPWPGQPAFWRFRAELVPAVWRLTLNRRSRVFQDTDLVSILREVFAGYDVQYTALNDLQTRPVGYRVQYQESDFAFASRLMEEAGVWYFFDHEAGGRLVPVDGEVQTPRDLPGGPVIFDPFVSTGQITSWWKEQRLTAGTASASDYHFGVPDNGATASRSVAGRVRVGGVEHALNAGDGHLIEVAEFPCGVPSHVESVSAAGVETLDRLGAVGEHANRLAGVRLDEAQAEAIVVRGGGGCARLAAGHKLELLGHPGNADGAYLLTRVEHDARLEGAYRPGAGTAAGFTYSNRFVATPGVMSHRPARVTPRPSVAGLHTAVVVGPPGQDVFADRYGRVRVQFHWDRGASAALRGADGLTLPQSRYWPGPPEGRPATSSCWVRVASEWAGPGYGTFSTPRVGQEVLVAYEYGDVDRPVVVGCVRNGRNLPPLGMPDYAHHAGIVSRSTGGGFTQASGLVFQDQAGGEFVKLHSERDLVFSAEGHQYLHVAGNVYRNVAGRTIDLTGSLPGLFAPSRDASNNPPPATPPPATTTAAPSATPAASTPAGPPNAGYSDPLNDPYKTVDYSKTVASTNESPVGKSGALNTGDVFYKGYFDGVPQSFGITAGMTCGLDLKSAVGWSCAIGVGGKLTVSLDPTSVAGMGPAIGTAVKAVAPYLAPLFGSVGLSFGSKLDVGTGHSFGMSFGSKVDVLPAQDGMKVLEKLMMVYNVVALLSLVGYTGYAGVARKRELDQVKDLARNLNPADKSKSDYGKTTWNQPSAERLAMGVGGGVLALGAVTLVVFATRMVIKKLLAEKAAKETKDLTEADALEAALSVATKAVVDALGTGTTKFDLHDGNFLAEYDVYAATAKKGVSLRAVGAGAADCHFTLSPTPVVGGITLRATHPGERPTVKLSKDGVTLQSGIPSAKVEVSSKGIVLSFGTSRVEIGAGGVTITSGPKSTFKVTPQEINSDGLTIKAKAAVLHEVETKMAKVSAAIHQIT